MIAVARNGWFQRARRNLWRLSPSTTVLLAIASSAAAAAPWLSSVEWDGPVVATHSPTPSHATIDLNTASVDELAVLPGVGPFLAMRIVDHRERYGRFESVAALDGVKGIGPAILDGLAQFASVDGRGAAAP